MNASGSIASALRVRVRKLGCSLVFSSQGLAQVTPSQHSSDVFTDQHCELETPRQAPAVADPPVGPDAEAAVTTPQVRQSAVS